MKRKIIMKVEDIVMLEVAIEVDEVAVVEAEEGEMLIIQAEELITKRIRDIKRLTFDISSK
jgi:hypothetical protein